MNKTTDLQHRLHRRQLGMEPILVVKDIKTDLMLREALAPPLLLDAAALPRVSLKAPLLASTAMDIPRINNNKPTTASAACQKAAAQFFFEVGSHCGNGPLNELKLEEYYQTKRINKYLNRACGKDKKCKTARVNAANMLASACGSDNQSVTVYTRDKNPLQFETRDLVKMATAELGAECVIKEGTRNYCSKPFLTTIRPCLVGHPQKPEKCTKEAIKEITCNDCMKRFYSAAKTQSEFFTDSKLPSQVVDWVENNVPDVCGRGFLGRDSNLPKDNVALLVQKEAFRNQAPSLTFWYQLPFMFIICYLFKLRI